MYYVRQEALQVALRFAARQSGRAFGLALAVRFALSQLRWPKGTIEAGKLIRRTSSDSRQEAGQKRGG
jgi:hypothetical protein